MQYAMASMGLSSPPRGEASSLGPCARDLNPARRASPPLPSPQMHNLYLPDLPAHDLSSDFVLLAEQILLDREAKVGIVWGSVTCGR